MQYYPGAAPSSIDLTWLQNELRRISEAFEQGSDRVRLVVTTVEPGKQTEGEIRIADGVNWDPGRGPGTYIFRGGAWNLIEAGFNKDLRSLEFFLGE